LVPALAGLVELSVFAYLHDIGAHSGTSPGVEAVAYLLGVLLVMSGLVIAGPWLTMLASRLLVRRANRPATLIAARRLGDNPKASFRAISGLVLAVFVGSCATGIIATTVADNIRGGVDARLSHALVDLVAGPDQRHRISVLPPAVSRGLASIPGVTGTAVIRDEPVAGPGGNQPQAPYGPINQVILCRELVQNPALGHCPVGASAAFVAPQFGGGAPGATPMSRTTWPAAPITPARLRHLPIDTIVVSTDGSTAAVERARTVLDRALPSTFAAETVSEINADNSRLLSNYERLAEIVILASLPIAGASLAVSIAGGLAERKRPFGLLRLTGAPLRVLRRVIGVEAAAPMLVTAAVSLGAGLLVAQLFVRAQLYETLQPPGLAFYVIILVGLVAALLIIGSTLPLLDRLTSPDAVRIE
jgi:hypothetical protein